jgi:hypothetical protein
MQLKKTNINNVGLFVCLFVPRVNFPGFPGRQQEPPGRAGS